VLRQRADRYGPLPTPSGESAVTSVDQTGSRNAEGRIVLGVSVRRALGTSACAHFEKTEARNAPGFCAHDKWHLILADFRM
jgi:hypothetical protein